jgi:hypothetical protein
MEESFHTEEQYGSFQAREIARLTLTQIRSSKAFVKKKELIPVF